MNEFRHLEGQLPADLTFPQIHCCIEAKNKLDAVAPPNPMRRFRSYEAAWAEDDPWLVLRDLFHFGLVIDSEIPDCILIITNVRRKFEDGAWESYFTWLERARASNCYSELEIVS